jgi:hypothetical protein
MKTAPDAMREAARPVGGTRDRSPDGEGTRPATSSAYAPLVAGASAGRHIFRALEEYPLDTFHPPRPPRWRFEGFAEVSRCPLDLAVLELDHLADVHAVRRGVRAKLRA